MIGWSMWWRRTWWALPAALVIQLFMMQNVQPVGDSVLPGWRVNWAWMLGVWNGATLLLSPFLAATAAMVVIRDWPRELHFQAAVMPRGAAVYRQIIGVLWCQGFIAQVLTLIPGVVICLAEGAPLETGTWPWQLFTGPAAILASVTLGAGVGALLQDIWAVPMVGVGIFLAHRVFFWRAYPELFTMEFPTWYHDDARPIPSLLIATTALNLVTAGITYLVLRWIMSTPGFRRRSLLVGAVAGLVLAAAIYIPFVLSGDRSTYEYFK